MNLKLLIGLMNHQRRSGLVGKKIALAAEGRRFESPV